MKYLSLATLAFLACGVPGHNDEPPRDGYQYEIDGQTVAIIYEANSRSPSTVDIEIQVNEHGFALGMSSSAGLQNIDGQVAALSQEERKALALAAQDYARQQQVNDASSLEQKTVYRAFDYLANAPEEQAVSQANKTGD